MRNFWILMFLCIWFICGTITAYAAEEGNEAPKPLNEVFDRVVIVPSDYHGKAFAGGQKIDLDTNSKIVQKDGHVLVPIRLMGNLATQVDRYNGSWEAVWEPKNPNDVLLKNTNLNKAIQFKVNSKEMIVNKQPQTMDVAPQKINGQIVLPLRSAAEALNKKIEWWDGLIVISDVSVDLRSPESLAMKDQIKAELSDTRQRVDYYDSNKIVYPITKNGDTVYYYRVIYQNNNNIEQLYKKTGQQKEIQIKLNGNPYFSYAKLINNELYYPTMVNNKAELDALNLVDDTNRKVASLGTWKPSDGWLADIQTIDNELYIDLHSGDLTMGSETLYKVDNGALKEVAGAKSFIRFVKDGTNMYFTDFSPMSSVSDNLYRVDMKTGKSEAFGEKGFTYGIDRRVGNGISYSSTGALYIKDGYLYTLGYNESDSKDTSAVYKINLADQTQIKLTDPASQFWIVDNRIYYIDISTGYLESVDLEGKDRRTLVEKKVQNVQFYNGNIYYKVNVDENASSFDPGELDRYDLAKGKEIKLSDRSVSSFYVGKAGIYYVNNGFDSGLYKIDADGRNIRLIKDNINTAILTDDGMVYTLTYEAGIYSAK